MWHCKRLSAAVPLAVLATAALAQTANLDWGPPPPKTLIAEQQKGHTLSSELIGMDVFTDDDFPVGYIDGLVFDAEYRVVAAIVSIGGVLGIGAKRVAVSWDEFDVRPRDDLARVRVSRARLDRGPHFKSKDLIRAERAAARNELKRKLDSGQQPD